MDTKFFWVTYTRKAWQRTGIISWTGVVTAGDYETIKNYGPDSKYGYTLLDAHPATEDDWNEQYMENEHG